MSCDAAFSISLERGTFEYLQKLAAKDGPEFAPTDPDNVGRCKRLSECGLVSMDRTYLSLTALGRSAARATVVSQPDGTVLISASALYDSRK